MATVVTNITGKFREAFESYDPVTSNDQVWAETKATGDEVWVDGNAASASYLVISKSPWNAGTTTSVEPKNFPFMLPVELAVGAHMTQRTLGQEFYIDIADTDELIPDVQDIAISSFVHGNALITVTTATPHNLPAGRRISIHGFADSRFNYPALTVATIPSPVQFTCTAGPGGNLPNITATVNSQGFVSVRQTLGRARNGTTMCFESATATQASFFVRAASGDSLPSGSATTRLTTQAATIGTTASVALVTAGANIDPYSPTNEYRCIAQADRVQWSDATIDALTASTSRFLSTQVCPDPKRNYKFRVRAINNKALSVPVAQIVSAVKTGTTTATITTDREHGLTTSDVVTVYGIRDQAAASFPNLTTATAVASVPSTTSFTIVIGTASTVTSYGGYVARVNGGNLPSSLGAIAQVVQSAALATDAAGVRRLTLIGSGNWAGLTFGDTLELIGIRNSTNGATLGLDGAWKAVSASTTTMVLVPIGSRRVGLPADFTTTNCGGAAIRRTDLRLSYVRVFDYERQRVEMLPRPATDLAMAVPVALQGGTTAVTGTLTGVTTVTTVSAVTSGNLGIPGIIADVASAAITTTTTTAAVTPTFGTGYSVSIPVTAVTGTTPTLDISIEESDDTGTNWFKVYDFPRITGTGIYRSPLIRMIGNRLRYVQTVTGGTPSFTRAINRLQSSASSEAVRQLIDRTIDLTTLNSTTPVLDARDCGNRSQLVINVGPITTTAPQLQLEGSEDNSTWYAIGTPLTAIASSTVQLTVIDVNSAFMRARVSTAGVGVTAGYVLIKAHD